MKLNFTKSVLALSLIGLSATAVAQNTATDSTNRFQKREFRTWSIGLNGGILTAATPFNNVNNGDFKSPQISWGYGAYVKKQILAGFGIQADFMAGTVKGVRANTLPAGSDAQNNSSYVSRINWSGDLSAVFTVANLSLNQKRNFLAPYLTAGAGYMSSAALVRNTPDGNTTNYHNNWFVPIGAGVKLGLSRVINIDLGYSVSFMKSRDFDGVVGPLNDRFAYAHAGIEIALGKKNSSQLQNFSPIAAIREESAAESNELRNRLAISEQQRLHDEAQYAAASAQLARDMADDDMDGVANKYDKCPNTPSNTVVDGAGCPLVVPARIIHEKVIVTEEDRKVVGEAIRNLEFDLGKATIKERSFPTLDRVAGLLVQKNFSLKLAGHTDNSGSMSLNLALSKDRAEAVKAYLVSKGANASTIEATGYGPNQPIATNKTAAGRQQNRRVEFSLF
ncbi:OmpA family protein [Mucilaginibacter gotjawali]|uniref:Outer membrane porin F n=2 Tax=Mucilaginibacter gotjawali TaxID=1550579 RepID=A0A0X8X2F0_9SPHI|nr:OmpA family protein [Mucilaginibacter gotjawali]MBB3058629.1 OOP family OmpA-OmpF porin [Mucilaginibacter gotjawali]BAU52404.1 Outer membrane porin F precursor [Mucilaginibacter gotjawali]